MIFFPFFQFFSDPPNLPIYSTSFLLYYKTKQKQTSKQNKKTQKYQNKKYTTHTHKDTQTTETLLCYPATLRDRAWPVMS